MNTKEYDFVCSLGGNCSGASNLKQRGMRTFSLPFDWTYIKSGNAINNLAKCFQEGFKNFLLKENLQELTEDEYNRAHTDNAQYKDTYTGYYYVNHFSKKIDNSDEYEIVKTKLDRRIKRMLEYIDNSDKILFVLSTCFQIEEEPLINLINVLKELYPSKVFDIVSIAFSCEKDELIEHPNVKMFRYKRDNNVYDYIRTNYEWAFLDDVKLVNINKKVNINEKEKPVLLKIKKVKRGISIHLFSKLPTIAAFKLYFFGIRYNFCLGKIKNGIEI